MYVNKQALRDAVELAAEVFTDEERKELARQLLAGTGWGVFERAAVVAAAEMLERSVS